MFEPKKWCKNKNEKKKGIAEPVFSDITARVPRAHRSPQVIKPSHRACLPRSQEIQAVELASMKW